MASYRLNAGLLLLIEAPFFPELGIQEAYTPASLLADSVEDLEDFFLLTSVDQSLSCDGEGPKRYTSYTTATQSVLGCKQYALTTYRSFTCAHIPQINLACV
jgi:hypothetical protein